MRPMQFTTTALPTADTDSICLSQTPLAAGNLTIAGVLASGGVATLVSLSAKPRYGLQLTVGCAGSDAGRTFTITGTAPGGKAQTETIAGSNASATAGVLFWETVTRVAVDAATAGAIIVGTAQIGATDWLPLDVYTPNQVQTISTDVSGTINYTWQYTNDDPFDTSITPVPYSHPTAGMVAATTDQIAGTTTQMRAVRLKINSGNGTARNVITQQSAA